MASILAIGPHPDDVEIAMGGTVCLLLAQGHQVTVCDLTNGEPTPMGTPQRRAAEAAAAARLLGISRRITLDLPNRALEHTLEARRRVAEVIREVRPDALFVPYWVDAHPDHVAACSIAEAARFWAKLTKTDMRGEPHYPRRVYHFFSTHYALHVRPSFIVDISPYMETKMAAVAAYASQFSAARGTAWILDEIRDVGRYFGRLIARDYGEPFVCREEIGVVRWDGLI
ncbi:MAG: bacillithiol biosynthesis deacetylase BshB1 [Armatimonadota bacterium]|nr:bacillithiol biosynthesis deacetylase BshB1 [Armatimonadota bacterium]